MGRFHVGGREGEEESEDGGSVRRYRLSLGDGDGGEEKEGGGGKEVIAEPGDVKEVTAMGLTGWKRVERNWERSAVKQEKGGEKGGEKGKSKKPRLSRRWTSFGLRKEM